MVLKNLSLPQQNGDETWRFSLLKEVCCLRR
jgi:hypothetical protein